MLNWLFKKYGVGRAPSPPAGSAPAAKARKTAATPDTAAEAQASVQAQRVAKDSAKAAQAAARTAEDWPGQLQRALGDDTALLHVANTAPGLDIKLAAVEALAGEDALRQAERAFRTRDRKVHRVAKARLNTAVTQRTARATAQQLLQRGETLLLDALLPMNHLVALDREWQALPTPLLEPTQHANYTALRARLDTAMRHRGDAEQALQRWTAHARRAVADTPAALAAAAALPADASRPALGTLCSVLQDLRDTRPAATSTATLDTALAGLLQAVAEAHVHPDAPAPAPAPLHDEPSATQDATPALADDNDPAMQADADAQARAGAPADPAPAAPRERRATPEQCQQLQTLLDQADTALAEGQLAALQRHLQAADALQAAHKRATWPTALRTRQQALRAEQQRLKSWQSWGGTRARDDLIAEAEALARSVKPLYGSPPPDTAPAAPQPMPDETASETAIEQRAGTVIETTGQAPTETASETASESLPEATTAHNRPRPKLNLRRHAIAIHELRMRWRSLDKLGEGAHGTLWQRFDAALTTAFEPVAAQHAAQQAARVQNLATRQGLLNSVDAAALPDTAAGDTLAAWRDLARQLDAFQQAWRQLGPLEHTVPAEARTAVQQRHDAAVERLEQPLRRVREQAVAQREQLIDRVQSLVPTDGRAPHGGDMQRQLRELQADWQEHARALPLPRGLEGALWNRFRATTDAVFAQRDAAATAREAEQAAEVAQREALIERLTALDAQADAAQIERTLAEVHRAWMAAPAQLPRSTGQALQVRYEAAAAAAAAVTAAAVRVRWHAQIDAWIRPLQLAAPVPDGALSDASAATGSHIDDLLLQLEIALDLPAAPEWQAARRQLKLRALKEAMEGRSTPPQGPAPAARWLTTVREHAALNPLQRQRALALLTALREAAPGALGLPIPAALVTGPP